MNTTHVMGTPTPAMVGLGFKPQFFTAIQAAKVAPLDFYEVHAENYMEPGGYWHHQLTQLRATHELSIHGVALSLGGVEPLDTQHLAALQSLIQRYQPRWFSEHLAWSSHDGAYLNDLFAIAYTDSALHRVCAHIEQTQDFLARQLLLENPSSYIDCAASSWHEAEFIAEVVKRTGCGLLLDVNNVYVSSVNQSWDPVDYLRRLPLHAVGEIHLAGHTRDPNVPFELLIDDHGQAVMPAVWQLYQQVLTWIGGVPTLIERDQNIPDWSQLYDEAQLARQYLVAAAAIDALAPAR